ncbi:MAG: hypothetical protein IPI91_13145 [Flavobacteriales bacterium]|nr:hypothetical protein [Flavobacteriales bacterium]
MQNITGGQGTAVVGTNDEYDLEITDNDLCTSVEFVSAISSGTEGGGQWRSPWPSPTHPVQSQLQLMWPSPAAALQM